MQITTTISKQLQLLTLIFLCHTAFADTGRVFVSNERGDSVSVFDGNTNQVISTIPVGKRPRGVGISPDGTEVYVAVSLDNLIAVVDPVKLEVIRTFSCGDDPEAFAVHPNGNIYAGIYQNGSSKGYIEWDKNWNEKGSSNKDYCLELFSIDDFKP